MKELGIGPSGRSALDFMRSVAKKRSDARNHNTLLLVCVSTAKETLSFMLSRNLRFLTVCSRTPHGHVSAIEHLI